MPKIAPSGLINLPLMSLAADGDCMLNLDALTGGLLKADWAVVLFVLRADGRSEKTPVLRLTEFGENCICLFV